MEDDEIDSLNSSFEIRPNTSFEIRPQSQYEYREAEENQLNANEENILNNKPKSCASKRFKSKAVKALLYSRFTKTNNGKYIRREGENKVAIHPPTPQRAKKIKKVQSKKLVK